MLLLLQAWGNAPPPRTVNNGRAVAPARRAAEPHALKSAAAPRPVSGWAAVVARGTSARAPAPGPAPALAPAPAPADQARPATAAEAAAPAAPGADAERKRGGPSTLPQPPPQPGGVLAGRTADGARCGHGA